MSGSARGWRSALRLTRSNSSAASRRASSALSNSSGGKDGDDGPEFIGGNLAEVVNAHGAGVLDLDRLLPASLSLEPQYLRGDVALFGVGEQKARYLGIGLDLGRVELFAEMLAQRRRRHLHAHGDLLGRDAVGGHRADDLPRLLCLGRF